MKTILSLFTFVTLVVECFGENTAINGQIELKAFFRGKDDFSVQIRSTSTNKVNVVGPLESGFFYKPQTYWLEAQDANGNALKPKLPTSFGQRKLKANKDLNFAYLFWPKDGSGDYSEPLLEITLEDLDNPPQKIKESPPPLPKGILGGSTGHHAFLHYNRMTEIKEPDMTYNIQFDEYHLRRWFDFETNKNYSLKVKLQPTKDSPVFESNPVIMKLSDKSQKKHLLPAESIKKSN